MDLSGKRVVITGAAGVLGKAVVERAESLGASVIALDLAFHEAVGSEQHVIDLLDAAAVHKLATSVGPVDGLFNIAGGFAMGTPAHANDDTEWSRMFDINVTTMRNMVKAVVPGMLAAGSGKIVNVGALGALSGQADMSAYIAAKSTVMRLTESLSNELRDKGINVNAVLPSVIDTPGNREAMPDADPSHWVSPADLASAVCFLGSNAGRALHGALVPVRGLS